MNDNKNTNTVETSMGGAVSVDAHVMRKKRTNCIGCKYLSKLSELGYKYCLNKKNKFGSTLIENVNIKQWYCPLNYDA